MKILYDPETPRLGEFFFMFPLFSLSSYERKSAFKLWRDSAIVNVDAKNSLRCIGF